MMWRRLAVRRTAAGWVLALALISPASAHAIIVASVPAAGETTADPPPYLVLRFNGRIEKAFSSVTLVGPDVRPLQLAVREADQLDSLIYRLPPLSPGRHQAKWKVLSADGHITEGVLTFTVVTPLRP